MPIAFIACSGLRFMFFIRFLTETKSVLMFCSAAVSSRICSMVECGLEKTAVQAILDHKNFSTTPNKYVSHNDPAYLLQEMQKMKY